VLKGELLAGVNAADGGLGPMGARAPGSRIRREGGKDTRLPMSFLVAVTPARIHVYKIRRWWGWITISRELAVFDRDGLIVDVSGDRMKRFTLHSPAAGQTMAFEMLRHRVTEEMEQALR
jgi:hypothetical protein